MRSTPCLRAPEPEARWTHTMPRTRSAVRRALLAAGISTAGLLAVVPLHEARADGIVFRLPVLGQTSYTFTSTTIAAFRTSNYDPNRFDDFILGFTERYDSAFAAPPWRLQIRLDGFVPFYSQPYLTVAPSTADCPERLCYLRPDGRIQTGIDPTTGEPTYVYTGIRPERIALRYQRGMLLMEGGDVYTVIGRGTALAFRKYDPLGIDTTIRGGRFEVDTGRLVIRGFGGVANPQNLDPVTQAIWQDNQTPNTFTLRPAYDALGGGEMVARLGADEDIEFGVHGLRVYFPESLLRSSFVDVLGYRFTAPSLFDSTLSLHVEVNGLRRILNSFGTPVTHPDGSESQGALRATRDEFGRGIYASALLTLGNWSALFDWKDYTNYIVSPDGSANDNRRVYSGSPSLERDDVQLRTNYNARGGRVRVNHAFRPSPWSLTMTALVEGLAEEADRDPWSADGIGVVHGYAEIRRRGRPATRTRTSSGTTGSSQQGAAADAGGGTAPVSSAATGSLGGGTRVAAGDWQFSASLGYRHEFLLGAQGRRNEGGFRRAAGEPDWQVLHGDVDIALALDLNNSIEVRIDGRYEHRFTEILPDGTGAGYYSYFRGGITGTWSHSDRLQVSVVARYDQFLASQRPGSDIPVFYPAGEIRYRFMAGSTIRLFGGLTPGGRLCSGGLCRDVPPFQGALAELILRI